MENSKKRIFKKTISKLPILMRKALGFEVDIEKEFIALESKLPDPDNKLETLKYIAEILSKNIITQDIKEAKSLLDIFNKSLDNYSYLRTEVLNHSIDILHEEKVKIIDETDYLKECINQCNSSNSKNVAVDNYLTSKNKQEITEELIRYLLSVIKNSKLGVSEILEKQRKKESKIETNLKNELAQIDSIDDKIKLVILKKQEYLLNRDDITFGSSAQIFEQTGKNWDKPLFFDKTCDDILNLLYEEKKFSSGKAEFKESNQSSNGNRTEILINDSFRDMDINGLKYAFNFEADYELFIQLLINLCEEKPYTIPNTLIKLKNKCKTKLASTLGDLHGKLRDINLKDDKEYLDILRTLNHFNGMSNFDLCKALQR